MPNHHVIHACGHIEVHDVAQPLPTRRKEIEALGKRACRACKLVQQGDAAEIVANEQGLPPLEGSPKQIKWAETIRRKALDSPLNSIDRLKPPLPSRYSEIASRIGVGERTVANRVWIAIEQARVVRRRLETVTDAQHWIEKRATLNMIVLDTFLNTMDREFPGQFLRSDPLWRPLASTPELVPLSRAAHTRLKRPLPKHSDAPLRSALG